jgi:hypothetical protein
MVGAMCLVADLAVFAGSVATIFGLSWYQDTKRKGRLENQQKRKKRSSLITKYWLNK